MNRLSQVLLALPVGIPIVYLGGVVVCGGFESANMLFLLSIICTLGLALLFWVPLCWVVGWAVLFGASQLMPSRDSQPILAEAVDRSQLTPDEIAVIRYMYAARRSGMSVSRADNSLRNNGWDDAIIQRARQYMRRL